MTTDLDVITRWIALLAIASAVQALVLTGAVLAGVIAWRRSMRALTELERTHLAPISAHVAAAVDDLQDITARVRRVDAAVRERVEDWGGIARVARDAVVARTWPLLGAARALAAGLRVMAGPREGPALPRAAERADVH